MGLIAKMKTLWIARKVVNQMGDIKRGWKTLPFWVTLIGNLITLAAALKGVIPANTALIIGVVLASVYNVLRGVQKSKESGVRNPFLTSEFWVSIGTMASGAIVSLQQGGVNAGWMATANTILAGVMTINRDLSHKQPEAPKP